MIVLDVRNVHEALRRSIAEILPNAVPAETRNGRALVAPAPVVTVYRRPVERVLFGEARDANPFFHLVEALWMLNGSRDLATLERYVGQIRAYSDDGETLRGAYGARWRSWFERDQLDFLIQQLQRNPMSRRAGVLTMWDPMTDPYAAASGDLDVPCNLIAHLNVSPSSGALDLTVFCRSNDAIWGAYGANAVHFSVLHEYVALAIGRPVGVYRQISVDLHYYDTAQLSRIRADVADPAGALAGLSRYERRDLFKVAPLPLFQHGIRFNVEVRELLGRIEDLDEAAPHSPSGLSEPLLRDVAWPMIVAHDLYKQGALQSDPEDRAEAATQARGILAEAQRRQTEAHGVANDWLAAGLDWLWKRRQRALREVEPS